MKLDNIDTFNRGWFVGNFEPSLIKTNDVEIAYKTHKAGDKENKHLHKIATEITLIIEGEVLMNNVKYSSGEMITIAPGEATDFECLSDTKSMVVKYPGASDDKYEIE